MASTNASAGAGDSGDRREGCSGTNKPAENNQATTSTQVIRAEITGSETATAAGVTVDIRSIGRGAALTVDESASCRLAPLNDKGQRERFEDLVARAGL